LSPASASRLRVAVAWTGAGLILVFMLVPTVVVLMTSVNPTPILAFPPKGLSLHWYVRAVTYPDFQQAFVNGLIVSTFASSTALVVGTAFAYLVDRYAFTGRGLLEATLSSPLIIPHFTTGFGFLLLAANLGLMRSYTVVVITHVVLVLPFVTRSVYVSLRNLDPNLERSAANLGASPRAVLLRVTLPLLVPGLVGGWLIAAILSLTEFTASLFVTAYRTQTLPVAMYTYIREYTDPTIAAISAILILSTTLIMLIAHRFLGLGRILAIEGH
jgi:putative spermidine/putrescine transport system permease protein